MTVTVGVSNTVQVAFKSNIRVKSLNAYQSSC